MLIKFFFKITFLAMVPINLLLAIDIDVSVGGNAVISTLEKKEIKYIKTIPNDKCLTYIENSNIKKDEHGNPFVFILDNFNYKSGLTNYLVYKVDSFGKINQNTPIDSIKFVNNACAEDVLIDLNMNDDKATFDAGLIKYGYGDIIEKFKNIRDTNSPSSKFNKDLKALEKKYLSKGAEHTSTGDKEFLTTSSYLLACLTFNEDIINIKKSLELNKIVLQDEYTIYPNNVNTVVKYKRISTSAPYVFGDNYKKVMLQELTSVSEYLSENVILFIFKFRADIDPLFQKIKTILLLIFVPATGILLMLTKATKKIGKINDFEDVGEKVIMALLMFVLFYFAGEGHKVKNLYGEEKSIHLNNYQNLSTSLMFHNMMSIANEGSNIFSKNYINFKRTSAGFNTQAEVQATIKENLELNTIREALIGTPKGGGENLIKECQKMYNTSKIQDRFNLESISFPGRIQFEKYINSNQANNISQYYNEGFNEKDNIPYLSIPLCNQFERELRETNKLIEINNHKLKVTVEALSNNKEQEQLLKIADIQYKSSSELGIISIPQIAVTNIVTDNLGLFNTTRNNDKLLSYMKESSEKSGLDDGGVLNFIFENLPYMVIPGATAVQETISSSIKGFGAILTEFIKGWGYVVKKILKYSSDLAGTVITIIIMKFMVDYFPVVALSMASLMVISWYFISVFVYSLASPFMIVYAISTQQTDSIKSYIIKGVVLAFKPLLIVISIAIALLAVYLINDLSIMMFEGNFTLLIDVVKTDTSGTLIDYLLMFFKGLVMLGASMVGVLSAFYFVWSGAEILLGFIGFKETGVDVKEAVGASIEGKTSKFNTPGT